MCFSVHMPEESNLIWRLTTEAPVCFDKMRVLNFKSVGTHFPAEKTTFERGCLLFGVWEKAFFYVRFVRIRLSC